MSGNGLQSYANERPPSLVGSGENDLTVDQTNSGLAVTSSFFMDDYKKHNELKSMLDGNKDNLKLEAMKRIIGMVAKGKDASDLFAPVVKNVVSKNIEIKKLVYVYLTRYAEEQQDLALLSISTFQRALKDPNQLIRASALRVLSGIRVPMIVPIMMLAIKEAVMDMSPYVRKTAAHAIPKLYSIDPEQKEQLIEVIDKLLADKTTLVIGSAIQAFEEVCPERIDLIHKNYRKLCNLLVDVEEWGQVVIVNMLTRYCRSQFIDPNKEGVIDAPEKEFYESEKDEDADEEDTQSVPYVMDSDHQLLLRQAKPLLNSMNAAVVVSVAQLYHHCAPYSDVGVVAKALVRLLRSHKEIQYVVLSCVATMSLKWKGMFEPHLKSFYIRTNDPTHIKLLKLEILTNLASESNISTILREFQTYITSTNKEFAAATIQALGRCASNITEVTEACLTGLVHLMSNRDEMVVAESVVVIKKLLQIQPSEHKDIIVHMAKILDKITVPMARASILWLIGEYCDRVPRIAPDVLRRMAKSFIDEEDIVKLQILNLATKLFVTNSKHSTIKLLCQYIFNLAKYDLNYDIRDRARFLRAIIMPVEKGELSSKARKIFLSTKPAPIVESKFKERDQFQLGSLSHVINMHAIGYQELPIWPEVAPDPTVRNVVIPSWETPVTLAKEVRERRSKNFYSSTSSSSSDDSDSDESSGKKEGDCESNISNDDDDDDEEKSEESSSEEETSTALSTSDEADVRKDAKANEIVSSEDNEDTTDDDSSSSEDNEKENVPIKEVKKEPSISKSLSPPTRPTNTSAKKTVAKSSTDLLLNLDDDIEHDSSKTVTKMGGDILTPSLASDIGMQQPTNILDLPMMSSQIILPSSYQPMTHELLNRIKGKGLAVSYLFPRTISVFSPNMVSIQLNLTNFSDKPIKNISISKKMIPSGFSLQEFPPIETLGSGATTQVLVSADFNDTTQPITFVLSVDGDQHHLSLLAPVGELLQPHTISLNEFNMQRGKLSGMNENKGEAQRSDGSCTNQQLCEQVYKVANIIQVPCPEEHSFAFCGKTLSSGTLVLIKVMVSDGKAQVYVNCEKMVIGAMLVKDLKSALENL